MKGNLRIGEIPAAWACCAMLALGMFLGEMGDTQDDPVITTYAGAHLPGAGGAGVPDREPDEERNDDQITNSPYAAPVATVSAKLRTGRPCWYRLRQSRSGYSAAARLAEAGAVSAGVREAAQ
jgi:hypothetical protein